MPQAVVAASITTGLSFAFNAIPVGMTISQFFFTNLAITATTQAIGKALANDNASSGPQMQGRSVMFRSSTAPQQVIYGEAVVSGPIVYAASSGADNRYLHLVIPLAGHQVEAIDEVYFNDETASDFDQYAKQHVVRLEYIGMDPISVTIDGVLFSAVTVPDLSAAINAHANYTANWEVNNDESPQYSIFVHRVTPGVEMVITGARIKTLESAFSAYRIKKHLGTSDQAADPDLVAEVPEWTTDHRLRGIAYIYVRLTWNTDVWPNGVPNIKAKVRGKRVQGISGLEHSDNWALCVNDYLRSADGFNLSAEEVSAAELSNAILVSDEQVEYQPGQFQPRYTINGAFTLDRPPLDILAELVGAGAGAAVYQMGQWRLHAGAAQAAEAVGLGINDLRDPIKFKPRTSRQELFNAVRGTFINPADFYQPTDFPIVTNAGFEAEDGGQQIVTDITLPFTDDVYAAQRLATIALIEHRNAAVVEWPCKITGLRYNVWDVVPVTVEALGWTNKLFRIIDFNLESIGGPTLLLKAYDVNTWAHDVNSVAAYVTPSVSSLASPRNVNPPTDLLLYSGTDQLLAGSDGTIISRILADWHTNDAFHRHDEVQYRINGDIEWTPAGQTEAQQLLIGPVSDGENYDVRVRTVNTLGVRSAWVEVTNHTVIGKTAAPATPTGLTITELADGTRQLATTATVPLDSAGFIYRARLGTHINWASLSAASGGIELTLTPVSQNPWETAQLPAGTYTIGVIQVDTTGNPSNALLNQYILGPNPAQIAAAAALSATWPSITGTGKPQDNATVGATWGVNVSSIPFGQVLNNIINPNEWVVGSTGTQGAFSAYAGGGQDQIILDIGPHGGSEPIWVATSDGTGLPAGNADGGWHTSIGANNGFDHTKSYRFSVWVKHPSSNSALSSGKFYLGCGGSGQTLDLAGAVNGNPYFISGSPPAADKWYLLVGILHGSGYTGTHTGKSGFYDPETGKIVNSGAYRADYKNAVGATNQVMRAYYYYAAAAGDKQYFARPRVDLVDGNEPSIIELLGTADVTDYAFLATDAQNKANAAAGAARILAETNASTYADGIVTQAEADAIAAAAQDATNKADAAKAAAILAANATIENGVITVKRPIGATYSSSGNPQSGAIVVRLPQSWSNQMMRMDIDVYTFRQDESFTVQCGGYNYSHTTQWLNEFARVIGSTASDNRVRFGHDGTRCVIVIGSATADGAASAWYYPQIAVRNFMAGLSGVTIDQWIDDWSVSIVNPATSWAASGYAFTGEFSNALLDARSVDGLGAAQINNQLVTINADGTLSGAGGGQINALSLLNGPAQAGATNGATIGANLSGAFNQATWDAAMPSTYINSAHIDSLSADLITTGTLAADFIASGSLVGQTLTGGTIQTGSSGKRIVLNGTTNEAEFYDATGAKQATIGNSTVGSDTVTVNVGSLTANYTGVYAQSNAAMAGKFHAAAQVGLQAVSSSASTGHSALLLKRDSSLSNVGRPFLHVDLPAGVTALPLGWTSSGSPTWDPPAFATAGEFVMDASFQRLFLSDGTNWHEFMIGDGGLQAATGYIRFSNGFQICWGGDVRNANGAFSLPFANAFTSVYMCLGITHITNSDRTAHMASGVSTTAVTFTATSFQNWNSGYIAIGYSA